MKPKLLLCLALVFSGVLVGSLSGIKSSGPKANNSLSAKDVQEVNEALQKMKPGMPSQEVMAILEKTPFNRHLPGGRVDGNNRSLRTLYYLGACNLMLVFDCTTEPSRFVSYTKYGNGWN